MSDVISLHRQHLAGIEQKLNLMLVKLGEIHLRVGMLENNVLGTLFRLDAIEELLDRTEARPDATEAQP